MERKVIVIVGPTCSGKTTAAIELANILNTEIISADSRQIFKYLNIGTAKPTPQELKKIKHHFIDQLNPDENFNVSIFESKSLEIINSLHSQNKIPIVVGGSGLYIKALVEGIFDDVDIDEDYRNELKFKREKFGNQSLYEDLIKVDPESASKMLPQNWKRVMRALEVYHLTGFPIGKFHKEHKRITEKVFFQFGLEWDRDLLYKNINNRVDRMYKDGLIDEVKNILNMGYNKNINALNTVGYKEIISYLEGAISEERAIELIKRNTRHFAKRQMTWFRKNREIEWIKCDNSKKTEDITSVIRKKVLGS